jgi:hypothetical protein
MHAIEKLKRKGPKLDFYFFLKKKKNQQRFSYNFMKILFSPYDEFFFTIRYLHDSF